MAKGKTKVSESAGVTSFVLSIVAFVFGWIPLIGLALSVLAIVFGSKQRAIKKTGLGNAGFIIGIITTVINGLWTFFILFATMI